MPERSNHILHTGDGEGIGLIVTINIRHSIEIDECSAQILQVRRKAFFNECKVIPDTDKLFIRGYVKKDIKYSLSEFYSSFTFKSNVKWKTIEEPFECTVNLPSANRPFSSDIKCNPIWINTDDNPDAERTIIFAKVRLSENRCSENIDAVRENLNNCQGQDGQTAKDIFNSSNTQNSNKENGITGMIRNKFVGSQITVGLKGSLEITGEVVFNFEEVIALKSMNTIHFINKDDIVYFY